MGDKSKIEWTDATWGPVTGCTRVSAGCDHCYIDRSPPFRMNGRKFDKPGVGGTTGVLLHPDRLDQPLRWRKPRKVFVNSLSDLFHDQVPDEYIARVWAVMALAPRHTFQVLTKRPARMRALLSAPATDSDAFIWKVKDAMWNWALPTFGEPASRGWHALDPKAWWPLRNVWLGVSVDDQKAADLRIPKLLATPAAVRFLSCEPLLGPVDLDGYLTSLGPCATCDGQGSVPVPGGGAACPACNFDDRMNRGPSPIDWVIAGGESGPGARPMHPDWARSLRDQCVQAGVAYLFKQWGEHVTVDQMPPVTYLDWDLKHAGEVWPEDTQWRVGKKAAGRLLDGRTWDEYPEVSA